MSKDRTAAHATAVSENELGSHTTECVFGHNERWYGKALQCDRGTARLRWRPRSTTARPATRAFREPDESACVAVPPSWKDDGGLRLRPGPLTTRRSGAIAPSGLRGDRGSAAERRSSPYPYPEAVIGARLPASTMVICIASHTARGRRARMRRLGSPPNRLRRRLPLDSPRGETDAVPPIRRPLAPAPTPTRSRRTSRSGKPIPTFLTSQSVERAVACVSVCDESCAECWRYRAATAAATARR